MKLVSVNNTTMINPEHISEITIRQDYSDTAYVIATITLFNNHFYEMRIHAYMNEAYPFEPLDYFIRQLGVQWLCITAITAENGAKSVSISAPYAFYSSTITVSCQKAMKFDDMRAMSRG